MILDALFTAILWIVNLVIGTFIRALGNPITVDYGTTSALNTFTQKIYLVNQFLPLTEITYCLTIISLVVTAWAIFKLFMWITSLLRIGKGYSK